MIKQTTLTAQYLNGIKSIPIPTQRRKVSERVVSVKGASGHNLKNINIDFPLGMLICVTGVSGSGKSSLINETLYPVISNKLYKSNVKPLKYKSVEGLENLDKVIKIDQAPIGKTRSNPATYTEFLMK